MNDGKYIVACVNGVPPSDTVCDYAAWMAKASNKELKLFHTLDHHSQGQKSDLSGNIGLGAKSELLDDLVEAEHEQNKLLNQQARGILDEAKVRVEKLGINNPKLCLLSGLLIENLLDLTDEIALTVIGRYGQNHQDKVVDEVVGHHVENVIRSLERPVLVVSQDFTEPTSILLAYDGSKAAKKALEFFCEQPIFQGKEIHVIHTEKKSTESDEILNEATSALSATYKNVKSVSLEGQATESIFNYLTENNISMMVMGAFGHNRIHDFIKGSFTSKMLAKNDIPLLLIR